MTGSPQLPSPLPLAPDPRGFLRPYTGPRWEPLAAAAGPGELSLATTTRRPTRSASMLTRASFCLSPLLCGCGMGGSGIMSPIISRAFSALSPPWRRPSMREVMVGMSTRLRRSPSSTAESQASSAGLGASSSPSSPSPS